MPNGQGAYIRQDHLNPWYDFTLLFIRAKLKPARQNSAPLSASQASSSTNNDKTSFAPPLQTSYKKPNPIEPFEVSSKNTRLTINVVKTLKSRLSTVWRSASHILVPTNADYSLRADVNDWSFEELRRIECGNTWIRLYADAFIGGFAQFIQEQEDNVQTGRLWEFDVRKEGNLRALFGKDVMEDVALWEYISKGIEEYGI
ncbi:hypothetical protein BJ508DRAFT_324949 [Ascobolus immersus RN42]|uniref:Uncharacterized protein n=1 Tax=Ascobolus immersus RN42 TaxID=1160509 RepID=A0A3N4IAG1_ASCIM|nr:hypothetical protein BJ508DRAFT_324949 [Ascobolus immersus RN42]